jgi:uncharacterized membrane protein
MDDQRLELLAATFPDEQGAGKALATIAPTLGESIGMAAVVLKQQDGKVRWVETQDRTAGQGAIQGAGLGALAGLAGVLFTPLALLGAPVGAAIGALTGKLRDSGFEDEELKALGADLPLGGSALIATLDPGRTERARSLLDNANADKVVVRGISTSLADVLDQELAAGAHGTSLLRKDGGGEPL